MWSIPEKFQLHLSMLALQFGYAGFHVVSRAALNMGISKIVFPVYRNILAFLLLLPFAYFLEKKERPPLTWNFAVQFFLLAIVGIEKVRLDRKDGMSKVAGTLFCVAGASVITLYKGPTIYSPAPPLQRAAAVAASPEFLSMLGDAKGKNWTLGCIFLIGHCLSWSAWLVLQAPVLKKYPARLSFTSYQCFFGVIQFLGIAAFLERDLQAWLVHSGAELFSVFYAVCDPNPPFFFNVSLYLLNSSNSYVKNSLHGSTGKRVIPYDRKTTIPNFASSLFEVKI
ncbi:UNVERIFIED_CONTAM: protein WALLS ARE THIN 1 [Sesamum radiatum]